MGYIAWLCQTLTSLVCLYWIISLICRWRLYWITSLVLLFCICRCWFIYSPFVVTVSDYIPLISCFVYVNVDLYHVPFVVTVSVLILFPWSPVLYIQVLIPIFLLWCLYWLYSPDLLFYISRCWFPSFYFGVYTDLHPLFSFQCQPMQLELLWVPYWPFYSL